MKAYLSPSLQEHNVGVGDFGTEMERAFQVADLVDAYLVAAGVETRTSKTAWSGLESNVLLAKVVADSNAFGADVHVCMHTNAGPPDADGTLVLYYPGSSKGYKLASKIYGRLKDVSPGSDLGLRTSPLFYETRKANAPVAYIEAVFHTNKVEAEDYVFARKLYAWAIAAGVLEYFGKPVPVKPLASFRSLRVPVPMRPPWWWRHLQKYMQRVAATG